MYQLANTKVSVLRGTTTNAYGDVVDTSTVHASGIPAFLTEELVSAYDPSTQTPRVVRTVKATLPGTTDVTESDRILDELASTTYMVESVMLPQVPGRRGDLVLILRQVS